MKLVRKLRYTGRLCIGSPIKILGGHSWQHCYHCKHWNDRFLFRPRGRARVFNSGEAVWLLYARPPEKYSFPGVTQCPHSAKENNGRLPHVNNNSKAAWKTIESGGISESMYREALVKKQMLKR